MEFLKFVIGECVDLWGDFAKFVVFVIVFGIMFSPIILFIYLICLEVNS